MRSSNGTRSLLTASAACSILFGVAANVTYGQSVGTSTNGANSNCTSQVGGSTSTNCISPGASNQNKSNANSNGGTGTGTSNGSNTSGTNGTKSTGGATGTGTGSGTGSGAASGTSGSGSGQ